jgi:hypothetical protein
MKNPRAIVLMFLVTTAVAGLAVQESTAQVVPEGAAQVEQESAAQTEQRLAETTWKKESSCMKCHGEADLWEGDRLRFFITEKHLASDLHWQKGIQCHDCHGGNPESLNFREAHSAEAGYRVIASPQDIPQFCGHCHSNVEYMSRYIPSPKTNQEADYWTGGHGQRLKENAESGVANCVSCHGFHEILPIDDQQSPTYPTNVAKTCATCHSDAEKMAGIEYHGRPIGHDQYELWSTSVHAALLLEKGDLSAPTCNDCHGNHGAVAPDVNSVASACATCHVKIGELFNSAAMKHRFEEANLPGCATCHGKHDIHQPTDEMLGLEKGAVCTTCHVDGKFGATLAGSLQAKTMSERLQELKQRILDSEAKVEHAEQLGMEVRRAKFRLHDARTALKTARVSIHSFAPEPMNENIEQGMSVVHEVDEQAEDALREHTFRRVWLGLFLLPIALVVVLLMLYIQTLPPPTIQDYEH